MVKNCSVEDCEKRVHGRGWCSKHYRRWHRHGSVEIALPNASGPAHPCWNENISYHGAHQRVHKARGKAADQVCSCGELAAQWAYSHLDPNELTGIDKGQKVSYSVDPKHYVAMCISCHKNFDLSRIKESA